MVIITQREYHTDDMSPVPRDLLHALFFSLKIDTGIILM